MLPEKRDQLSELVPRVLTAGLVLADLRPKASRDVLQAQRRARRLDLSDAPLGVLALGSFYFFRLSSVGGFRGAVKSIPCQWKSKCQNGERGLR
jgi:hypothetical protein